MKRNPAVQIFVYNSILLTDFEFNCTEGDLSLPVILVLHGFQSYSKL